MPVSIVFISRERPKLIKENGLTGTILIIKATYIRYCMLTELMDIVALFPVVGSFLWTDTTQHPHPPSPHILLVPDNP